MLAATGNLSRIFRRLTVRAAILALVSCRTTATLVGTLVLFVIHLVSYDVEVTSSSDPRQIGLTAVNSPLPCPLALLLSR
jgi:hypothetical protein